MYQPKSVAVARAHKTRFSLKQIIRKLPCIVNAKESSLEMRTLLLGPKFSTLMQEFAQNSGTKNVLTQQEWQSAVRSWYRAGLEKDDGLQNDRGVFVDIINRAASYVLKDLKKSHPKDHKHDCTA